MRTTLLYMSSEVVIPAKAGIQIENTGFRVKPGMTIKVTPVRKDGAFTPPFP
jgi:hypothetical protein